MRSLFVIAVITILNLHCAESVPTPRSDDDLEFIILHNNDMHARFEQTSVTSGKCLPEDANTNKCYGGFARTAHLIRQYREEAKNGSGKPILYLNAGDTYTGTPWFTVFRDNITAAFLNALSPDAISLGNHEFDEGVEGLVPFLQNAKFPVLASNLDLAKTPELAVSSLQKSTVLTVNGTSIGIIGYLTPDTKSLNAPNEVEYFPEIISINNEAAKLKQQGINILIALGHSGYLKDQEIAKSCPEIDIVIGGHSHTFLYEGEPPSQERPSGLYPTVVTQSGGKRVPVVQAYAFTKYLGKLHVIFDKNGNLKEFDGKPILLDHNIARDSDILALLEVYRPNITALENTTVGHTKTLLDGNGKVCRSGECNLGSLIADSMVYARLIENENALYWTDAAIAFVQGGGIRSSIEKSSDGSITKDQLLIVLPFGNDLYMVNVSGKLIVNALEHSATRYKTDSDGAYLQMSGVHVVYNMLAELGQRVVSVEVLCADCQIPGYSKIKLDKYYNIIVTDFLLDGGDGHVFKTEDTPTPIRLQKNDVDALHTLIADRQIVYPAVEGRIIHDSSSSISITGSIFTILVALIFKFSLL